MRTQHLLQAPQTARAVTQVQTQHRPAVLGEHRRGGQGGGGGGPRN